MGFTPSGHSVIDADSARHLIKAGGYLAFAQAHNGKIYVMIQQPNVEEIMIENNVLTVGKFEPEKITEEFIIKQVEAFITSLITWEDDGSRPPLGYMPESKES